MSKYGDQLNTLTVRVTSSDGLVAAEIQGKGTASVSFTRPDAIDLYRGPEDLGSAVAQAIELAMAETKQQRRRLVDEVSRLTVDTDPHWDANTRRFQREVEKIGSFGVSPQQWVEAGSMGMSHWEINVAHDVFETAYPGELCSEINLAVRDAHQDHALQVHDLKRKYFTDVGPSMRGNRSRRGVLPALIWRTSTAYAIWIGVA